MSLYSIKRKKMTSGLTILGIVIGITAIVSLLSIGEGLESSISEQLEAFGSDKIMVMSAMVGGMPGSMLMGEALEDHDVETIEKINGVEVAVGMLMKTLPAEYNNKVISTYAAGLPADKSKEFFSDIQSFQLEDGRFFDENDAKVVVIGSKVAEDMFEKEVRIGAKIKIKDVDYKVIGVLKSTGSSQDDQSLIIPLDSLRDLTDSSDDLTMIFAKASDASRVDYIAEKIEDKLDSKYGDDAYMAMTSEQVASQVASIFGVVSIVLGGIAFIALIVAGVGITNTMFMSVMERTREIGVMKAIGATNTEIMEIFVVESALMGLIGGIAGCTLGAVISFLISVVGAQALPITLKASTPLWLIALGLGFSITIGIISGLWPARRAAKLNPVDALRYE